MGGPVKDAEEAIGLLAAAMRRAGVVEAEFGDGCPVLSMRIEPEPYRAHLTDPAPEPREELTPEEAERRARAEYERIQFGSAGG